MQMELTNNGRDKFKLNSAHRLTKCSSNVSSLDLTKMH